MERFFLRVCVEWRHLSVVVLRFDGGGPRGRKSKMSVSVLFTLSLFVSRVFESNHCVKVMDSDNDSNDGPIHRRRTQGTRPPSNTSANPMHRMSAPGPAAATGASDRSYHPSKEEGPYSDDDELDEEDEDHPAPTYRGRGRPSQQHLMDSSYDDGDDLPRYTGPLREQDRFLPIANVAKIMKKGVPEKGKIAKDAKETIQE